MKADDQVHLDIDLLILVVSELYQIKRLMFAFALTERDLQTSRPFGQRFQPHHWKWALSSPGLRLFERKT